MNTGIQSAPAWPDVSPGAVWCDHRFELAVRKRGETGLLARVPADPTYLRVLTEDVLWQARRRGLVGQDRSDARWLVEPVGAGAGTGGADPAPGAPPPGHDPVHAEFEVHGLRVTVSAGPFGAGARYTKTGSPQVMKSVAWSLLGDMLARHQVQKGDHLDVVLLARPEPPAAPAGAPSDSNRPRLKSRRRVGEPPQVTVPGRLDRHLDRAVSFLPGEEVAGDTPVFIHRKVLRLTQRHCRRLVDREGGAWLTGRLVEQSEDPREIFVVIEGAFEARHVAQETFQLTPSAAAYQHARDRLEARRRRLGRPEEILVGFAHGHPFLPSLDAQGVARCPACDRRDTCESHSAFFSEEDSRFHRALFLRQPFAVGLVWGLDARGRDVLGVYGFRDGLMAPRNLHVMERAAAAAASEPPGAGPDADRGSNPTSNTTSNTTS